MSRALSASFAPCLIKAWQPLASGEWIEPGMAKTSLPCSAARRAEMSEPLSTAASTTRQQREAADQAVAAREIGGKRTCTERKFRHQRAACGELVRQLAVARRVNDVGAGTEHRHTACGSGQAATVRRGVNAERKPADYGQAGVGECPGKDFGIGQALRGRMAAADDGQRRTREQIDAPFDVEQRRGIRNLQEWPGIAGVREGQHVIAGVLQPGAYDGNGLFLPALLDRGRHRFCDMPRERGTARRQRLLGPAKSSEHAAHAFAAQTRGKAQPEPGGEILG